MHSDDDHDGLRPVVLTHTEEAATGSPARPAFFTASETAEILRLDESTLYRHLRSGSFPGLKIGGRYVVPGAVLDRLVAAVLATGGCIDVSRWAEVWHKQQVEAVAAVREAVLPGGDV